MSQLPSMRNRDVYAACNRAETILRARRLTSAAVLQKLRLVETARFLRESRRGLQISVGGERKISGIIEEVAEKHRIDARHMWRYWKEAMSYQESCPEAKVGRSHRTPLALKHSTGPAVPVAAQILMPLVPALSCRLAQPAGVKCLPVYSGIDTGMVKVRHSAKDERHRGEYKTLRNNVGAFDEEGTMIGVVFETATPFDTPRRMTELLAWLEDARTNKTLHPLLIVAVFIVVFLQSTRFKTATVTYRAFSRRCYCSRQAMNSPIWLRRFSTTPERKAV